MQNDNCPVVVWNNLSRLHRTATIKDRYTTHFSFTILSLQVIVYIMCAIVGWVDNVVLVIIVNSSYIFKGKDYVWFSTAIGMGSVGNHVAVRLPKGHSNTDTWWYRYSYRPPIQIHKTCSVRQNASSMVWSSLDRLIMCKFWISNWNV